MKKAICILLSVLSLVFPLCGCGAGGQKDCASLLEDITALFPDLPTTESVYLPDSEGASPLGEQDASYVYTGEYGTLPEWEQVEDYAVRLPDRPQIYEVHVLKVKADGSVESVSKMLCRRADLLAKYFVTPEKTGDYDYSAYRAEVYVKDSYVFLLATPDNDKVIGLIEKSL